MLRMRPLIIAVTTALILSTKLLAGDAVQLPAKFDLAAIEGTSKLTRDQVQGKKVLIQFWASWCVGCSKVMEDLQPLSPDGSKSMYLSISLDENKDLARGYFKHQKDVVKGMMAKSWIDPETSLATHLKIKSLPALVMIDGQGKVIESLYGHPNAEQMKKIEAFLK